MSHDEFRAALLDAGLLVDGGVPGLYGHGEAFDAVVRAVDALITETGLVDQPERPRFPPLRKLTRWPCRTISSCTTSTGRRRAGLGEGEAATATGPEAASRRRRRTR